MAVEMSAAERRCQIRRSCGTRGEGGAGGGGVAEEVEPVLAHD